MSNTILIRIEIPAWVVNSDRCFEVPLFSGALATYSNSGIRSNMRACRGFTVSVEGNLRLKADYGGFRTFSSHVWVVFAIPVAGMWKNSDRRKKE